MRQSKKATKPGRVICFDLFGTLIRSAYRGPKYYELLAQRLPGFTPAYVSAAIRGQAMNWHALHWNFEGEDMFLNEGEAESDKYCELLKRRLGSAFDQNPNFHHPSLIEKVFARMPEPPSAEEIIACWKAENDMLEWIPGARDILKKLRPNSALVFASNITWVGKQAVVERLPGLPRMFKGHYWSCDLPTSKPDPYVWQLIVQDFPGAEEYWMIGDDPIIDLAVPAAMGWKTVLVKDGDFRPIAEAFGIEIGEANGNRHR